MILRVSGYDEETLEVVPADEREEAKGHECGKCQCKSMPSHDCG
jgi:hypothetical protein